MRSLPALLPSPLGFCNLCRGVPARSIREQAVQHPIRRLRFEAVEVFDAGAGVEDDDALADVDLADGAARL